MRLVALSVSGFACIKSANLELGPGLNVLYGPNDLGKSSLVQAIRFALLVQDNSAEQEEIVGWTGAARPRVQLTFQTTDGRYWRVTKEFDRTRGTSLLESSKDGRDFVQEARARAVDGKLRELLQWGIPQPGGRGAPRGLPESFLSTLLVPDQGDVSSILSGTLANDGDPSGRERITRTLKALAEDPTVKAIAEDVQEKVDEAFGPRGAKKRGQNDPFPRSAERIRRANVDLEELRVKAEKSRGVVENIKRLTTDRLDLEAKLDTARRRAAALETAGALLELRLAISRRLDDARTRVKVIDEAAADLSSKEALARTREGELAARREELTELDARIVEAEASFSAAEQARKDAESGGAEQARRIEAETLARKIAELQVQRAALASRLEALRRIAAAEKELADLSRAAEDREREVASLQQKDQDAAAELALARAVEAWIAARSAEQAVRAAEQAEATARDLAGRAAARRKEADDLGAALERRNDPDPKVVEQLTALEAERRLALAAVGVGLELELRPKKRIKTAVTIDGVPAARQTTSKPQSFSAEREILLDFEEVAEIVVRGGAEPARARAAEIEERWKLEAEPILVRHEADDTARLAALLAERKKLIDQRADLLREAESLEQQQKAYAGSCADLGQKRALLAERESRLAGYDRADLEKRAAALSGTTAADLEKAAALSGTAAADLIRKLESRVGSAREAHAEAKSRLGTAVSMRDSAEDRLAKGRLALPEESSPSPSPSPSPSDTAEVERSLSSIDTAVAQARGALANLDESKKDALKDLDAKVVAAKSVLEAARASAANARQRCEQAVAALARARADVEAQEKLFAALDRDAAVRDVAAIEAELEAAPKPEIEVTEAELSAANAAVSDVTSRLAEVTKSLDREHGALGTVGGAVVEEQRQAAAEALRLAEQADRELELDYAAWKLLLDTLKQAQSEQSSHLGQALGAPLSERFKELTGNRYDAVALGAELETKGVVRAGAERAVERLSLGTREQLSTIFRLALAVQLTTSLLLDDQLVQADEQRLEWFGRQLRSAAETIQVVVLTCRPRDYLLPAELSQPEPARANGAKLRVVDLSRIIQPS